MKKIFMLLSAGLLLLAISCSKTSQQDVQPASDNASATLERTAVTDNNASRQMLLRATVYYDTKRFNVELQRYQSKIPHTSMSKMYVITESNPVGTRPRFLPVVDRIPTVNFTVDAVWQQVYITFGPGRAPYQITTSQEVEKLLSTGAVAATPTANFFEMKIQYSIDPSASSK